MRSLLTLSAVIGSFVLVPEASAFIVPRNGGANARIVRFDPKLFSVGSNEFKEAESIQCSREGFLASIPALLAFPLACPIPCVAVDGRTKVLVLGGSGFVGSQVVKILKDKGVETIATSTNGRDNTVALDFTKDSVDQQVEKLAAGCTAVISCIGAIGTENDETINAGTGLAAQGAKAAGVKRFVYITVAPEVKEFARDIDFLKPYMEGKTFSRDAVLTAFGQNGILIEPTFIYGGGSFELNPPRVSSNYGNFIEAILSSSPIRNVERLVSPGLVKIALEPPVSVEDVAGAAVAGALGKTLPVLDTYDKIKLASAQL